MKFCDWPQNIRHVVFLDFDETVRPVSENARRNTDIRELENVLEKLSQQNGLIFGWISGSNFSSLLAKSEGYIGLYPHFIGASLGSELLLSQSRSYEVASEWAKHIGQSGFHLSIVDKFVEAAAQKGLVLVPQDNAYQGIYKRSYYLHESNLASTGLSLNDLAECNKHQSLSVFATKCNPLAGDPEDAYDVDLLPSCASKGRQCEFIRNTFSVDRHKTIAFGDSANDSEMLSFVAHPFVVENGDIASITAKFTVTEGRYCEGITHALKKMFPADEACAETALS